MLNLQKVVVLLDEFHLHEFRKHLEETKAELPLKLVDAARRIGWEEKDSDELCRAIYKKAGPAEKRKFFQLAHHTFKLTGYLSRNYPSYLLHNIPKIEQCVNNGNLSEAHALAEVLLDVAEKIEDFGTARSVLQFFAQHAYMREKKSEAVRFLERNAKVIEAEKDLNEIYLYLRSHLHFKDKSVPGEEERKKHLEFFRRFHDGESFSVRIMGRYATIYALHFLNDEQFYSQETFDELNHLAEEVEKSPYVIFSFSDDIELNIDYLKLKVMFSWQRPEALQEEAAALLKKRQTPRFWKNYLNTTQIAFLSIQASMLISRYGFGYREGWNENLPEDVRTEARFCTKLCEELLGNPGWDEKKMHVRFINVNNIYCCLLLLGTKKDFKKVTEILEGLLFNYQQVAFHRMYDQIFATLIMAYFMLGENLKVQECYKRYEKLTANSSKLPENDMTIKAFYYVAQWLHSGRRQYQDKLNALLEKTGNTPGLENARNLVTDLKEYYGIK